MTQTNQAVFADTAYWIAMSDNRDELHQRALLATTQVGSGRIITSELVLVEFLDGMSRRGTHNRQLAVATVRRLITDPNLDIVPMSTEQFGKALELYGTRLDHRWSLTDCASFLIMQDLGIQSALAEDHHFVQAGFRALMREV